MGILWFFRWKKVERSAVWWWSVDLTTEFLPSGFSSVNARWFRPTNRWRIYYIPCTRVRPSCPYAFNQFSNQTSRPPWRRQPQVVWTHCRIHSRSYTLGFFSTFFFSKSFMYPLQSSAANLTSNAGNKFIYFRVFFLLTPLEYVRICTVNTSKRYSD